MKDKFETIYTIISDNMKKLDEKKISVDEAKAMAALAKQANNVIVTQLDAAKFMKNTKNSSKYLANVGL